MPSASRIFFSTAVLASGFVLGSAFQLTGEAHAQDAGRVFEMRTYTATAGKLEALNARFRDHTLGFFAKHGMKNVGYWVPQDGPLKQTTLVYIISHDSREAAKKNWDAFRNDPEIRTVFAASEANGKLVAKVDSLFMDATDYSPLR